MASSLAATARCNSGISKRPANQSIPRATSGCRRCARSWKLPRSRPKWYMPST